MHGLHNMFYFERKKLTCSIFTIFVHECMSVAMFIFLLSIFFGKALANFFVTKCSILDVGGVLHGLHISLLISLHISYANFDDSVLQYGGLQVL